LDQIPADGFKAIAGGHGSKADLAALWGAGTGMLQEIMKRVGSQLLYPIPIKAEARVMATLAD
jgi:hypothetical protein